MPVTEFAVLKLRGGHDRLELLEALMQCQELQDEWMHQNQPCSVESNVNFSSMYFERPEPEPEPDEADEADAPALLITAPWDSPEAHGDWIQSRENQTCNGKLSEYIEPGCDSVLLFHVEPAGRRAQIRGAFLSKGTFHICNMTVAPGRRKPLQEAYQSLEDAVADRGMRHELWAGWRIEKSGDKEEFVIFWSDSVLGDRLRHLMSFADTKVHRRFKHVV
ncbi:hypothetical protein CDD83_10065 [Cordyceps sp. RAO-2017]|nr:hypothetical protein CDD83_10065 [Cordyceps sp. RAO-2017]